MKKIAIFDIDGTIFRSSLLIELTDALLQEGIFPSKARDAYAKAYKNWLERRDVYEKYIKAVIKSFWQNIKGIKHSDFLKVSKKVVAFHQNRVYRYSRDLLRELKHKNYYLLAISQSPRDVVAEFCKKLGFHKVYGYVCEIDRKGKFTGKALFADLIGDKSKILRRAIEKECLSLKGSIGVGDTESDIAFLRMVEKPICFNPNQELYHYAKRKGWMIVVERKDVIFRL